MASGIALTIDGEADDELVQATQIEVLESLGEATQFRLQYSFDISEADFPILVDERLNPGVEVALLATGDKGNECLVKGQVFGHEIQMLHGGAGSTLTVAGGDSCLRMNREAKLAQWVDMSDSDAVTSVLSAYGFTADVATTPAGHFADKHTLLQRDTDLQFVKRLARRNGFLFWITSDEFGLETAHFKPAPVDGEAVGDLVINLPGATLDELNISWDVERPTSVQAAQLDLNTLEQIDGNLAASARTVLGNRGLQAITGDTRSARVLAAVNDSGDLQARGQALLNESEWFVCAHCATSVVRLGRVVRAHQLVNLRGAGSRYSGVYLVASVRHLIDATTHIMEIGLVRNGWL